MKRLFSIVLWCASLIASAEEIRVNVAHIVKLSADVPDGERVALGISDAAAVTYDDASPFIIGVEFELKIPVEIQAVPGTLAYAIYKAVDPPPAQARYSYKGKQLTLQSLPQRAGLVVQIPVVESSGLKTSPYAVVLSGFAPISEFPLLFRLLPVTKGLPPSAENAKLQLRIRPVLSPDGALRISLKYPDSLDHKPVSIYVDERKVAEGRDPLFLKAGEHRIRVVSEDYRDENRTVLVERAKVVDVAIALQDPTPVVLFEAPDTAVISVDGMAADALIPGGIKLAPGEHVISCKIGDYTITRKIILYRGKTYKIVLTVDLVMQEVP